MGETEGSSMPPHYGRDRARDLLNSLRKESRIIHPGRPTTVRLSSKLLHLAFTETPHPNEEGGNLKANLQRYLGQEARRIRVRGGRDSSQEPESLDLSPLVACERLTLDRLSLSSMDGWSTCRNRLHLLQVTSLDNDSPMQRA